MEHYATFKCTQRDLTHVRCNEHDLYHINYSATRLKSRGDILKSSDGSEQLLVREEQFSSSSFFVVIGSRQPGEEVECTLALLKGM